MKQSRQEQLRKASRAISILAVVAFVGVAAATTLTARQVGAELEERVIANETRTPKNWETEEETAVAAATEVTGKVVSANYVEFTTAVTNESENGGIYLTHLASYLSEDGGDDGFMPLSGASLEYSFTPGDENSWTTLNLSLPSNSDEAFKLEDELHLGAAGTATDTVYFRYYVTPTEETELVSDKVSLLIRDEKGRAGYTEDETTVEYAEEVAETAGVVEGTTEGTDGEETEETAHVDPLGRFSFVPAIDAVTTTVASAADPNMGFLIFGAVVMIMAVAVFIACLVIYIPLRKQQVPQKKK